MIYSQLISQYAIIYFSKGRALQRAAAAAAVERARRARMARGGADAKGGGKGKGAEEREETCSICQCEFTVAGDGGVAFCCPTSHYMCNECCGTWGECTI